MPTIHLVHLVRVLYQRWIQPKMPKLSVALINLNGVSAMRKDFRSWVNDNQPDVICVQETKAQSTI